MNIANKITLVRIFLIPVFLLFLLMQFDFGVLRIYDYSLSYNELIALFIFIIAAATDGLDGYLARKHKIVTNLGKLLDPLADKILITAALIGLVELDRLPAWVAIVIISREFAVTGLRMIANVEGNVISASKLGKFKTIFQITALILLMLKNFPFTFLDVPVDQLVLYIAVVMTVWSGVDYFQKNANVISFKDAK